MDSCPEDEEDLKLIEAMGKMKAIAEEYEVAYLIILSNQTHTEFRQDFPKWSVLQNNEEGIRLSIKENNPELTDASFYLLSSIRDIAAVTYLRLQEAADKLGDLFEHHKHFGGKRRNF